MIDIAKQIVDQRVNKIMDENPELFVNDGADDERKRSKAFLLLGVAAFLNIDISEAAAYITEGSQDGGFDAAYILEAQDQLNVVLFQSKYVRNLDKDSAFPANAVEKAVHTIKGIFDPEMRLQLNEISKKKVEEIQSFILDGYIPYVTFVLMNNGQRWTQEGDCHIENEFGNQKQVRFEFFNHNDIIQYVSKPKEINTKITLSGVGISEDFNYKRVMLGRISVEEIYRVMEEFGDALLEKNIRKYLGKNVVNDNIRETLLSPEKKQNFFFFNNGITMICEKFLYNALQKENWIVKIEKLQIINGGQTCKTIFQTMKENPGSDFSQVFVLFRLYEVSNDEKMIQDITYATNNQNPVDLRDLKSNKDEQILIEQNAKELGYVYKRKRDNQTNTDSIPSSVAAEAILAVWRNRPHMAKYKKNEFFDQYYHIIFSETLNAAQMIIAVFIFRYCDNNRKKFDVNPDIQAQRPYSQYFIANLIGKIILSHFGFSVEKITHKNFSIIKDFFEENKEELYHEAEARMVNILKNYFSEPLPHIDGRTMAAAFRRFDIIQQYFESNKW